MNTRPSDEVIPEHPDGETYTGNSVGWIALLLFGGGFCLIIVVPAILYLSPSAREWTTAVLNTFWYTFLDILHQIGLKP